MFGQDFRKKDLRQYDMVEQVVQSCKLDYAELPDVLVGADLRGSSLIGARVAMRCSSFDRVKLDMHTFKMLMFILSKLDMKGTRLQEECLENLRCILNDYDAGTDIDPTRILFSMLTLDEYRRAHDLAEAL